MQRGLFASELIEFCEDLRTEEPLVTAFACHRVKWDDFDVSRFFDDSQAEIGVVSGLARLEN